MGRPRKWTQETVLRAIQQWAQNHDGSAPTPMDFARCRENLPHHKTVWEYFTSVHHAVAKAGLRRNMEGIAKRNAALARLRRHWGFDARKQQRNRS